MESRDPVADEQPSRIGYIAGIIISAIGHAALAVLVLFVLPRYLNSKRATPEAYTVKIVGQLPAGDLGTHLPRLSSRAKPRKESESKPPPPKPEQIAKNEPPPPEDKNAIALNTFGTPTPTPEIVATPIPATPAPTPVATLVPTAEATLAPTPPPPAPTPKPRRRPHRTPKPRPTPKQSERRKPEGKPSSMIAKAEHTPSVAEQLNKLKEHLLEEHLKNKEEEESDEEPETASGKSETTESGGGPVASNKTTEGKGYGVGPGTGGAGIQQDPEFLLYYRTVQEKVKKAWSFPGGSKDLTTTVDFAIGSDGTLTGVKITQSSRDPAFDDSVIRAIRRAAPFPAPPEKYRAQFAEGVEAVFKLGELSS